MKKMYSLLLIGAVAISGVATVGAQESSGGGHGKVSMQDFSMMREDSSTASHSGMMTGHSGSMMPRPPKPPRDGSGSEMEHGGKGLMLAIGKLTPEQKAELARMIRDYLLSKGVTLPTPPAGIELASWSFGASNPSSMSTGGGMGSGKMSKEDMKKKMEAAKAKRDEMKEKMKALGANGEGRKEYVGHVTLMK